MNIKKLTSRFFSALTVIVLVLASISCSETETTDSTKFTIYYSGMTDIGPSMSGIVSSPTYKGSAPSHFAITQISLKEEPFAGDCFTMNADNGSISINNTADVPVGLYRISVSCQSGGQTYEFKDIVEVNMMNAVPDGISVEPNKLKVDYADIIDAASEVELPTAQVKTDGNHVSIRKYEIAKSETSKFFAISQTGEISIVKGSQELLPGIYVLSLKLTTGASAEDEGLFENAVEINVTSKPLSLTYTPNTGKIEEETDGSTSFTTTAPVLKGSIEGVAYAIKSITPPTDKIEIDKATGVLSVAAGHGFTSGETFAVNVNVVNEYAPEGVDFNEVFTLEAVSFIEPIENFAYDDAAKTQSAAFEIAHTAAFKGDEVVFEWMELDAALQGQLAIDHEGTITAPKGNTIPLGTYPIKVKASNTKGEAATTFTLTIKENENFFTYIRYGNNLGLPVDENAFQYRVPAGGKLIDLDMDLPTTDAKVSVTWEVTPIHLTAGTSIDESTGELTLKSLKVNQCGMVIVTATTGKGTADAVSVSTPVFFHFSGKIKATTYDKVTERETPTGETVVVEYTPFVFRVNPKNGGQSQAPTVTGAKDPSKVKMDYRRSFNYYDLNGRHTSGIPATEGSFLNYRWDKYMEDVPNSGANYASKHPLSYYINAEKNKLSSALGYVDPKDCSIIINPNKWIQNDEYVNGVMFGQIPFATDGKIETVDNAKASQIFPFVLWLDEKF